MRYRTKEKLKDVLSVIGVIVFLVYVAILIANDWRGASSCEDRGGVWLSRESACVAGPR